MSSAIAEPMTTTHLMLSTKLIYELGDPHSTLRATADRSGSAVLVYAGGEVDACNEHTWQQLVGEVAAIVIASGPLVIDVTGLEFMGCCAFAVLAEEAQRCKDRGIELRLVSREPIVARVVDACGLSAILPIYPTADSALASAARW